MSTGNDATVDNADASSKASLRQRAKRVLKARADHSDVPSREFDASKLVHELEVHQVELELQNAELRAASLQAEEARVRYAELFDLAPFGYFTLGRSNLIEEVNRAGLLLLGDARRSLAGLHFGSLVAPEDWPIFAACIERAVGSGIKTHCELELRSLDGRTLSAHVEALASASRSVCRIAVVDLSERRRGEEALRRSSLEIEDLYQHAPCAYHTLDGQGRFVRVNDTELHWLGYARDAVVGTMKFVDLLSAGSRREFGAAWQRLRRTGVLNNAIWQMRSRDG